MDERLFQYIWSNLYFDFRQIRTQSGKQITIIDQGRLNSGDGPDFTDATIKVDDIEFHGAIELHLIASDWFRHNHDKDPAYNNVILHVILFEQDFCEVTRPDGTQPFTLLLKPFISPEILKVFKQSRNPNTLVCTPFIGKIPSATLQEQFQQSLSDYFEYKTEQLLPYFSFPGEPLEAWKRALAFGIFDGLGIIHNREPMKRLCHKALSRKETRYMSAVDLLEWLLKTSGLSDAKEGADIKRKEWSFSGTRPNNQPNIRIPQAAAILFHIFQLEPIADAQTVESLTKFFEDLDSLWARILPQKNSSCSPIGKKRKDILYATVYLPSLYIIGNKIGLESLKKRAYKRWQNHKQSLPQKITKVFQSAGVDQKIFKDNLGVVYHYKHFCSTGNCEGCKIMKHVLNT